MNSDRYGQSDAENGFGDLIRSGYAERLPGAEFRNRLLKETTRAVERRRRGRRVVQVVGILGAYVLGGLSVAALLQAPPGDVRSIPVAAESIDTRETVSPSLTVANLRDPEWLPRRLAESTADAQRTLLLEAGDLYLERMGDLERAVQCYRRWFELANGESALDLRTEDTWLLAALKTARRKEQTDA